MPGMTNAIAVGCRAGQPGCVPKMAQPFLGDDGAIPLSVQAEFPAACAAGNNPWATLFPAAAFGEPADVSMSVPKVKGSCCG